MEEKEEGTCRRRRIKEFELGLSVVVVLGKVAYGGRKKRWKVLQCRDEVMLVPLLLLLSLEEWKKLLLLLLSWKCKCCCCDRS